MIHYEDIKTKFGGMVKIVRKKSDVKNHVLVEERRYFIGIKYKEVSKLRKQSILDAWGLISGKDYELS